MAQLTLSFSEVPNGDNTVLFGNFIRSDGFGLDLIYNKRKQNRTIIESHDLTLDDFDYQEVEASYCPIFIDPGRKSVFTAAIGLKDAQQIRRCTIKEYYHLTGSTVYQKKLKKLKEANGIADIESGIPTPKTVVPEAYGAYTNYILEHKTELFTFNNFRRARDHFYLYQGRQKAPQLMVNMLVNGGKKYDRRQRKRKKKQRKRKKKQKERKKKQGRKNKPSSVQQPVEAK